MFCPASAVSARSMSRDRKPYQWETYGVGGRQKGTELLISCPVKDKRPLSSRCLRIWSHITNHLCEYPKIWALNSLPSEGYVSRRSFKIMRALNLASLFSPQPLQRLPISLERKAETGGPPTTPLSHCCSLTPCFGHTLLLGHIAYLLFL